MCAIENWQLTFEVSSSQKEVYFLKISKLLSNHQGDVTAFSSTSHGAQTDSDRSTWSHYLYTVWVCSGWLISKGRWTAIVWTSFSYRWSFSLMRFRRILWQNISTETMDSTMPQRINPMYVYSCRTFVKYYSAIGKVLITSYDCHIQPKSCNQPLLQSWASTETG